jgi:hypothetical protein
MQRVAFIAEKAALFQAPTSVVLAIFPALSVIMSLSMPQ